MSDGTTWYIVDKQIFFSTIFVFSRSFVGTCFDEYVIDLTQFLQVVDCFAWAFILNEYASG